MDPVRKKQTVGLLKQLRQPARSARSMTEQAAQDEYEAGLAARQGVPAAKKWITDRSPVLGGMLEPGPDTQGLAEDSNLATPYAPEYAAGIGETEDPNAPAALDSLVTPATAPEVEAAPEEEPAADTEVDMLGEEMLGGGSVVDKLRKRRPGSKKPGAQKKK